MNVKRCDYTARAARRTLGNLTILFDLQAERRFISERKAARLAHTGHWHAVAAFWRQPDRYLGRNPDEVVAALNRLYDEYVERAGDAGADAFWGGDLNVVFHTPGGYMEVSPSDVFVGYYWFAHEHEDMADFGLAMSVTRPGEGQTFETFCTDQWESAARDVFNVIAEFCGAATIPSGFTWDEEQE